MMNFIDLFCGGGGLSSGFVQAGFKPCLGIDIDKWSCETYAFNFPSAQIICKDIKYLTKFPHVDVVIGSPPCKEFSIGNIDRTFDDSLIKEFFRVINIVKPKYWVMENVPDVKKVLPKRIHTIILRSDEFGCATHRERLFASNFDFEPLERKPAKAVKDIININAPGFRQFYKPEVYRKINPDKPFVTLVEQRICNERYLLPNGRSLDITEMAMLQGFPNNFIFIGSRSEAQKMIGKSVCPPVAKAIAERIKKLECIK